MFNPAETVKRLQNVTAGGEADTYRALLGECRSLKSFADGRAAELARFVAEAAGGSDASDEIQRSTRCSSRDAKKKATTAEELPRMPSTRKSLNDGDITGAHADALAGLRSRLDEDQRIELDGDEAGLVAKAHRQSIDEFRKTLRGWKQAHSDDDGVTDVEKLRDKRRLSLSKRSDGMGVIRGELDPESYELVSRAVGAVANELFHGSKMVKGSLTGDHDADLSKAFANNGQLLADALVELSRRGVAGSAADGRRARATVVVNVDYQMLLNRLGSKAATLSDGTSIPAETVRRLACDADILPVVLGGAGQPLDVGRSRRLATAAQRIALRGQYPTCAIVWCDKPFDWCHIHHIDPWEKGGATDLDNLVPLCSKHHHLVHEGGWTTECKPDGGHRFKHKQASGARRSAPSEQATTTRQRAPGNRHQQPLLI